MPSWSRLARNIARKSLFTVVSQMRTSGSQAPTQTRKSQRNSMPSDGSQPRPLGAHSIREVDLSEGLAHTSYDPDPDGDADPGEVVWTWVPYEEDASRGKDRPVVVIGRSTKSGTHGVYVAQLTSKDHDRDARWEASQGRHWMDVGTGKWDSRGRPSEVRLDRILWVAHDEVRREGATLKRQIFERVINGMRTVDSNR